MPILKFQPDLHPPDLLETVCPNESRHWWLAYTRSRREKDLMRRLTAANFACYAPTYRKGQRNPSGRIRVVQAPLFPNYVFLFGDDDVRRAALASNCVSRIDPIAPSSSLTDDLKRLKAVLSGDREVVPEARLAPGKCVSIRSGPFRGLTGTLVKRDKVNRLVVAVDFIQRGASIEVFDFEVEAA